MNSTISPTAADESMSAYQRRQDNPFIAALPPVRSNVEAIELMQRSVVVTDNDRALPSHHRLQLLDDIADFVQPLSPHVNLFQSVSSVLRRGYVHRNPNRPGVIRLLNETPGLAPGAHNLRVVDSHRWQPTSGSGLTILGQSGVGKTTAINVILETYEQVKRHTGLKGTLSEVSQIVWLKISCPPDGSLKGLCLDFFRAIDDLCGTTYYEMYAGRDKTADRLRIAMARVAVLHGIGLLVIDELQNLTASKSGSSIDVMMNFFKLLRDDLHVPMVLVGTMKARRIIGDDPELARRHAGSPIWKPMLPDEEFELFCSSLFSSQFLRNPIELEPEVVTSAPWFSLLHDLSQGIAAVLVKLFTLAQARVLLTGREELKMEDFTATYDSCFALLHPFLNRMRAGYNTDGETFDAALGAVNKQSVDDVVNSPLPSLRTQAEVHPVHPPQKTAPAPVAEKPAKRKKSKKAGPASCCLLVEEVKAGAENQLSPHDTLLNGGFIRRLGDEAMAA